jgi:hypothetical protein
MRGTAQHVLPQPVVQAAEPKREHMTQSHQSISPLDYSAQASSLQQMPCIASLAPLADTDERIRIRLND